MRRSAGLEPVRSQRTGARRTALRLQTRLADRVARPCGPVVGPRPSRANRTGWRLECRTDRCRRLGHRGIRGKTHVTDAERAAFDAFAQARYTDAARPHLDTAKTYTFWDYQQLRFPATRACWIDFVLCSPALNDRVFDASIDKAARKEPGASDHAPVVLDMR